MIVRSYQSRLKIRWHSRRDNLHLAASTGNLQVTIHQELQFHQKGSGVIKSALSRRTRKRKLSQPGRWTWYNRKAGCLVVPLAGIEVSHTELEFLKSCIPEDLSFGRPQETGSRVPHLMPNLLTWNQILCSMQPLIKICKSEWFSRAGASHECG